MDATHAYCCFLSQIWHCDFCGIKNKVNVTLEEVPIEEDTTFVMSPPIHAEKDLAGLKIDAGATLVLFGHLRKHVHYD